MSYEPVDRVPHYEFGYWWECLETWRAQGLSKEIEFGQLENYFGIDVYQWFTANLGQCPGYESKIIEDKGDHVIGQDSTGVIYEQSKEALSIPKFIKFPIETREDWVSFRDTYLSVDEPARFSPGLDGYVESLKVRDFLIGTPYMSLYGWIRNWMGVENLSIAIMEDSPWIEEMMTTWFRCISLFLTALWAAFSSTSPLLSFIDDAIIIPIYQASTCV